MVEFGRLHCNQAVLQELSTWEGSVWYYDGLRVYYQIADYTGDDFWLSCARYVREVYRDYVIASNGVVPGWRVFPHGLFEDYQRTGDSLSREAALSLAKNSAFASQAGGASHELSRETAYLIHAYMTAAELGESHQVKLEQAVSYALGHLDQWTGSKRASYVQPFMMGLTFEALIRYFEATGDQRIPPALVNAANWLWSHWDAGQQKFPYVICRSGANVDCNPEADNTSVDLNLLIAPAYAWLYDMTGESKYRVRADAIFVGGVEGAYLGGGKQFSQNYRWSFAYLDWRSSRR